MKITIGKRFITVDGVRAGVTYRCGPWIAGVDPTTIKINPKRYSFPAEFRTAFAIENNSDAQSDYFESDCIRITSTHPLYDAVAVVAHGSRC
jgi:hypothetical protein